jgi:hypothetical protein
MAALQLKKTLLYDSAEYTMETRSWDVAFRLFICELKTRAPEGEVAGMMRVKSELFSEAVDRYPADPRPLVEETSCEVEI